MNPEQLPLRDLHLPEAIGWWPLAPGWWVLAALVLCGLAFAARAAYRRRQRSAGRRAALVELARLKAVYDSDGNLTALGLRLSDLLRRAMLAYAPRHEVAGLTGQAWLEWLDRGLDEKHFSKGAGRTLTELPYRRSPDGFEDVDVDGLIGAVRHRLQTPLEEAA